MSVKPGRAMALFEKMGITKLLRVVGRNARSAGRTVAKKVDDAVYKGKQLLVNRLLKNKNAKEWVGTGASRRAKNKFPDRGGPPGGILYRKNAQGDITYYAKYDSQGRMIKRVDFDRASAPHGGVNPPHTVDYNWHTGPNGKSSKTPGPTRPWKHGDL